MFHVRACLFVCVCADADASACLFSRSLSPHTCTHAPINTHTCTTYVHTQSHTHACTHKYANTYTQTNTHTHTYSPSCVAVLYRPTRSRLDTVNWAASLRTFPRAMYSGRTLTTVRLLVCVCMFVRVRTRVFACACVYVRVRVCV